jgi:hypothetical protein
MVGSSERPPSGRRSTPAPYCCETKFSVTPQLSCGAILKAAVLTRWPRKVSRGRGANLYPKITFLDSSRKFGIKEIFLADFNSF